MIKYFRCVVPILFLLTPLFVWAVEEPAPAAVEAILFESDADAEYVRIRLSNVVQPVIFQLPGKNPRVVCDLPAVSYPQTMKKLLPAGGDLIRRIRIGVHHKPEPKTRIVIDLLPKGEYSVVHEYDDADAVLAIRIALKTTKMKSGLVPTDTSASEEEFKTLDSGGAPVEPPASTEKGGVDSVEPVVETPPQPEEAPATAPPETTESEAEAAPVEKAPPEPKVPAATASPKTMENEVDDEPAVLLQQESTLKLGGEGQGGDDVREDELPVLLDITYETSTNGKEMALFRLSGFYPPVVFSTEGDDLLVVCDFLDAMLGYGIDPVLQTDGKYIQKVRVEKFSDPAKVRVVLDLSEGFNYDVKQVFFKEDNLFVVVISSLGKQE